MSAIELYARHKPGFEDRLAAAEAVLRQAAADHAGRVVQATSLGAEDMVVTDLIHRLGLPVAIGTLQTGALHEETVALIGRLEAHFGVQVEVYEPQTEAVVQFVRDHGQRAMFESIELRKACCGVRKMEPLGRMLAGRSAWITGLRREQSAARDQVQAIEADGADRVKVNPLVDWSWNDVWHYIATRQVPYNPLHDAFMPSIGCAPCTRAIALGEDFRSGRWWWESSTKECGLHVKA